MNDPVFAALQERLREVWPSVTLRSIGDVERTVVVVHSISMDVPDQLIPVFPAYEERFLCLVLSLLRAPRSRVVRIRPYLARIEGPEGDRAGLGHSRRPHQSGG